MSGIDSLLESIQETYAEIARVEAVAKSNPGDIYVLANLSSLKRRASSLEELWTEAATAQQQEVCRYRLLPEMEERYPIKRISQSLAQFQELFSQVYDATKNKIKSRRILPAHVVEETALDFAYAYPGSLGIAMSVPGGIDMFKHGKFSDAITALTDVMELTNQQEVRSVAGRYGIAVLRRAYDWSKTNATAGYGVDLSWVETTGVLKGTVAQVRDFERIVELIEKTSDEERRTRNVSGVLKGIDAQSKRFRFSQYDDESFTGFLADEFPSQVEWVVNAAYVAEIEEISTTSYATEETKVTYRLKALIRPDEAGELGI